MNTQAFLASGSVIYQALFARKLVSSGHRRLRDFLLLVWLVSGGLVSQSGRAQPVLQAILGVDGALVVEWIESGYRLERVAVLSTEPAWESVTTRPSFVEGRFRVELGLVDSALFFRLRSDPSGPPPDPGSIAPALPMRQETSFADATSFLYASTTPVQTGVVPGAVVAERVCVLKGTVLNRTGQPLEGVRVRWLGHSEMGQTQTRKDGQYDLVVNGGGTVVIEFGKPEYLTVHRQVAARWRDYVVVPTVSMAALDPLVTTVRLGRDAPEQVARGSVSLDTEGQRQATLILPEGIAAVIEMGDGTTRALDQIHVRATEYTVGTNGPSSMPSTLPSNVGYTYCVELSADEALDQGVRAVRFDRPLALYVDNFIGFPVGSQVPVGYYDRSAATWIASANGRVIRVIGITNGGVELDLDGDGVGDSVEKMTALGIGDSERVRLASLYSVGTELWRVPITHFTPWDCNWPYGIPTGATVPAAPLPLVKTGGETPKPDKDCGSWIEIQNQVLIDSIRVDGTPFTLNYRSDRAEGRRDLRSLPLNLSAAKIPNTVKRVEVEISVAGRNYGRSFAPADGVQWTFEWDRQDSYGRNVSGPQPALVRVGYVYGAVYQNPIQQEYSFGLFAETPLSVSRGDLEITLWNETATQLEGHWMEPAGLGPFTLSPHHHYSAATKTLYRGDGSRATIPMAGESVLTMVVSMEYPSAMVVGPDGTLFVAGMIRDANGKTVLRVMRKGADGILQPFAGSSDFGEVEDGGPALGMRLQDVSALALGRDGSLYIADHFVIHRVTPDGRIWKVLGDRTDGVSPDGSVAKVSKVGWTYFLAVASDGTLYFDEVDNGARLYRIRRIGPDGLLRTISGDGKGGNLGFTMPARDARFADGGILLGTGGAIGRDDTLYVAAGSIVRKLGSDGLLVPLTELIGQIRSSGDGGPASRASLTRVNSLAVDWAGNLYIACQKSFNSTVDDYRVRQIGTDGVIRTIAGTGLLGGRLDGPATQVPVVPRALATAPDGSLYISSTTYGSVQRLSRTGQRRNNEELWVPSESGAEVYVFTAEGRHLRTLDGLTGGTRHEFGYTSSGVLQSIRDSFTNILTILRDVESKALTLEAHGGQRTELKLDAEGRVSEVVGMGGATNRFEYDHGGLMTRHLGFGNQLHRYAYDGDGRLMLDQDPEGGSRTLERTELAEGFGVSVVTATGLTNRYLVGINSLGQRTRTHVDARGLAWVSVEGSDGKSVYRTPDGTVVNRSETSDPMWGMAAPVIDGISITTPGGLKSTVARQIRVSVVNATEKYPLGYSNLIELLTVNGERFTNSYDPAARVLSRSTPLGRTTRMVLDGSGMVLNTGRDGMYETQYTRDALGHVREIAAKDGNSERRWTVDYDAAGRAQRWTYPDGAATETTYEVSGRATTRRFPDGGIALYSYDLNGNATSVTPPGRPAHQFEYSGTDLTQAYIPPGGSVVRFEHDLEGRLTRYVRGDGVVVELDYGESDCHCGQLLSVQQRDGTTHYTYSPSTGRLLSIECPEGEVNRYEHDGLLMTRENWTGRVTGMVSRIYGPDFRVTSRLVNGGNAISYQRDRDGLLIRAGDMSLARDARSGLVTATTLLKLSDSRKFNGYGEVTEYEATHQSTQLMKLELQRDARGQLVSKVETELGITRVLNYDYDSVGRLVEVRENGETVESYAYDLNGNRLSTGGSRVSTAVHDDRDALVRTEESNATARLEYNGHLELTRRSVGTEVTEYVHTDLGQLKTVRLPGNVEIRYVLDGRQRRVGKLRNGVLVQGFLYQDQWRVMAELDGGNTVVARFIYGVHPHVPDYMIRDGVKYRFLADPVGSVRMVVNAETGDVVQRIRYDAFGRILEDTHPGFQPFGFAGGIQDSDTELVHFGHREYDPALGRWISRDPLLFGGRQFNFFAYAGNDPVNRIDPGGLVSIEATGYAGPGGGVKIAFDSRGISICGEIGLGKGVGVSVDPFEGIDGDSSSILAELSGKIGPLAGSVKGELDDCGRFTLEDKGCFGPFCGKLKGTAGSDAVESGGETSGDDLLSRVGDLLKQAVKSVGVEFEGKLAARGCTHHKW